MLCTRLLAQIFHSYPKMHPRIHSLVHSLIHQPQLGSLPQQSNSNFPVPRSLLNSKAQSSPAHRFPLPRERQSLPAAWVPSRARVAPAPWEPPLPEPQPAPAPPSPQRERAPREPGARQSSLARLWRSALAACPRLLPPPPAPHPLPLLSRFRSLPLPLPC